jgi:hypothetical protein
MGLQQAFDEMIEYGTGMKWEGSEDQKKRLAAQEWAANLPEMELIADHGVFEIMIDSEKISVVDENGNVEMSILRMAGSPLKETIGYIQDKYRESCPENLSNCIVCVVDSKIINMTPHPVHIVDDENNVVNTFDKSETMIRLSQTVEKSEPVCGIPTTVTKFGEPQGLPEFKAGTFYIVSQLVKSALPERSDLLVPAEVVRDKSGNIIGCKSLGR